MRACPCLPVFGLFSFFFTLKAVVRYTAARVSLSKRPRDILLL
uniref:Uncharacterized protein n=1 Tax=Anguilla anguilla TaxID=7936 RepID=A0A0E9S2M4_ANGAN